MRGSEEETRFGSVKVCEEVHEKENEFLEWADHLGSTRLRARQVGTGRGRQGSGKVESGRLRNMLGIGVHLY